MWPGALSCSKVSQVSSLNVLTDVDTRVHTRAMNTTSATSITTGTLVHVGNGKATWRIMVVNNDGTANLTRLHMPSKTEAMMHRYNEPITNLTASR